MPSPEEVGITNLGPVPEGMDFYTATVLSRPNRKYQINPGHQSRRLTFCETIREIHRETEKKSPDMDRIRELSAAAFDYGKRMDARMKELKCSRF